MANPAIHILVTILLCLLTFAMSSVHSALLFAGNHIQIITSLFGVSIIIFLTSSWETSLIFSSFDKLFRISFSDERHDGCHILRKATVKSNDHMS